MGCPVAKLEPVQGHRVMSVNESSKVQSSNVQASEGHLETFEDVDVPIEYKENVLSLLQRNTDLFAQKDSQLIQSR